jgi:hypothetical protein
MKDEYDFSKGVRGPVIPTPGKTRITIRLDDEVLEWFRQKVHAMGGGNYQTLMNAALHDHIAREEEPLEETLRRVIREELGTAVEAKDEMPQRTVDVPHAA